MRLCPAAVVLPLVLAVPALASAGPSDRLEAWGLVTGPVGEPAEVDEGWRGAAPTAIDPRLESWGLKPAAMPRNVRTLARPVADRDDRVAYRLQTWFGIHPEMDGALGGSPRQDDDDDGARTPD